MVLVVGVGWKRTQGSLSGAETGSFGERGTAECEGSALDDEITSTSLQVGFLGAFKEGGILGCHTVALPGVRMSPT